MIEVKISDGLGNQLFQYALGYSLAAEYGMELILDVSYFDLDDYRTYELDKLRLESRKTISYMQNLYKKRGIFRYFQVIMRILKKRYLLRHCLIIQEKNRLSDIYIDDKMDYYFRGFWQSEKYFLKYREELIRQFIPVYVFSKAYYDWRERIEKKDSVSIHIRRTDYVKYHAAIQPGFYLTAIEKIIELTSVEEFFLFTDDVKWAVQLFESFSFKIKYSCVSENSDLTDLEEMMLMKACKHHIVANSSFSWWGAWLGECENSIVVAPKLKAWNEDFYPQNWILIPAQTEDCLEKKNDKFVFRTWIINKIKEFGYI